MNSNGTHDPVGHFVSALVGCTHHIAMIVDHMMRNLSTDPAADPPPIVLERLLRDVLREPLSPRRRDLARATALISRAHEVIAEEVYLVDPHALGMEVDPGDLEFEEEGLGREDPPAAA